jgi:hypothetical protein
MHVHPLLQLLQCEDLLLNDASQHMSSPCTSDTSTSISYECMLHASKGAHCTFTAHVQQHPMHAQFSVNRTFHPINASAYGPWRPLLACLNTRRVQSLHMHSASATTQYACTSKALNSPTVHGVHCLHACTYDVSTHCTRTAQAQQDIMHAHAMHPVHPPSMASTASMMSWKSL